MFFSAAPANPIFKPVLVYEPVMLRPGVAADFAARLCSRTFASLAAYQHEARRGGGLSLLSFRQADGALVGGATLTNIRYGASRSAILGYWVGAPFVRKGYGAAGLKALAAHAFDRIGLNRLVAACQPENIASQKLLERCGFNREGLARDYLRINGEWRDHLIYAAIAAEHDTSAPMS